MEQAEVGVAAVTISLSIGDCPEEEVADVYKELEDVRRGSNSQPSRKAGSMAADMYNHDNRYLYPFHRAADAHREDPEESRLTHVS
jgi:hypothetical protein